MAVRGTAWVLGCLLAPCVAAAVAPCRIEVVEKGSDWPVPLVELRTTHEARLVTDNAGVIALDLPELMGRETWFYVSGHGYGVPKDGFGYRGVRLTPEPGKTLRVEVTRTIVAKRLGRLTGAGLFAEFYPAMENNLLAWGYRGPLTLPQLLQVNHWLVVVPFVAGGIAFLRWVERKGL